MMPPRQRKSAEERRREIIETALRLAESRGPEHITTEAIASAIGVTQPAVFRHFSRKDDIWAAVLEWLEETMRQRFAAAAAATVGAPGRLLAVVESQLRFIDSIPALPTVMLTWQLRPEQSNLRNGTAVLMRRFHDQLVGIVREGVADGTMAADPDRAAWLFIAVVQGVAIRWTLRQRTFDIVEEGLALARLALIGLQPPAGPSSAGR